jgi:hypothetical protein
MWPADVVAGLTMRPEENDGLLHESGSVVGGNEEAAAERWYHDEKESVKDLFEAGCTESSTAQRSRHPGYSRFETRSSDKLDWRDVTIVSPFFCTYNNVVPSHYASFTQALRQLTGTIVCLFNSYCSSHSFAA